MFKNYVKTALLKQSSLTTRQTQSTPVARLCPELCGCRCPCEGVQHMKTCAPGALAVACLIGNSVLLCSKGYRELPTFTCWSWTTNSLDDWNHQENLFLEPFRCSWNARTNIKIRKDMQAAMIIRLKRNFICCLIYSLHERMRGGFFPTNTPAAPQPSETSVDAVSHLKPVGERQVSITQQSQACNCLAFHADFVIERLVTSRNIWQTPFNQIPKYIL